MAGVRARQLDRKIDKIEQYGDGRGYLEVANTTEEQDD
jgi:hypothetical protein